MELAAEDDQRARCVWWRHVNGSESIAESCMASDPFALFRSCRNCCNNSCNRLDDASSAISEEALSGAGLVASCDNSCNSFDDAFSSAISEGDGLSSRGRGGSAASGTGGEMVQPNGRIPRVWFAGSERPSSRSAFTTSIRV